MTEAKQHPPVNPAGNVYQYYLMTGAYTDPKDGWQPTDHTGEAVPPGVFGNVQGLIEKLPEIKKMGFDTVWLGPVPTSNIKTGHGYGYDAIDYDVVNPLYGSEQQFADVMKEAHKLGLSVILDQVYNHTSSEHEWFKASQNPEHQKHKEYKDFYIWQDPIVGEKWDEKSGQIPLLKVPLRDSHGVIMKKHDMEGNQLAEDATVELKPIYNYMAGPLRDGSGEILKDEHGGWKFPPMQDEQGHILYQPNNYLSVIGNGDAWWYDTERKQCYLHVFHDSMPDLNIGNPDVNSALIKSAKHWITDKGVDGFRLDAASFASTHWSLQQSGEAQYKAVLSHDDLKKNLAEALGVEDLPDYLQLNSDQLSLFRQFAAGINSNPPNTFQSVGVGGEPPFPTPSILEKARAHFSLDKDMKDEDVLLFLGSIDTHLGERNGGNGGLLDGGGYRSQMHVRDVNQPSNTEFWKQFSDAVKVTRAPGERPVSLLFENGDNLMNLQLMADAGVLKPDQDAAYTSTFDGVRNPGDLRAAIENLQQFGNADFAQGKFMSFTPSNHDTLRITSRFGYDGNPAASKLLWSFFSRVPGNLSVYGGEELGLPSPTGNDIANLERDSFNYLTDRTGYNWGEQEKPSRDFDRAAYPWSNQDFDKDNLHGGQGKFFKTPECWRGLDYETQSKDPESVLNHYKKVMKERAQDPVLSTHGSMKFLDGGTEEKDVLIYTRSNEGDGMSGRVERGANANPNRGAHIYMDNFTDHPVTVNLEQLLKQNEASLDDNSKAALQKRVSAAKQTGVGCELTIAPYQSAQIDNIQAQAADLRR